MLDKTEFYTIRYCEIYQHLEVNDGKGCNVRQGHSRLYPLLRTNELHLFLLLPSYVNIVFVFHFYYLFRIEDIPTTFRIYKMNG